MDDSHEEENIWQAVGNIPLVKYNSKEKPTLFILNVFINLLYLFPDHKKG